MEFKNGIYEQIVTESLKEYLDNIYKEKEIEIDDIEKEEANIVLSKHLKHVVELALKRVKEEGKNNKNSLLKQIELSNKIIKLVCEEVDKELLDDLVSQEGKILYSITEKMNNASNVNDKVPIYRPKTPISQSSLFTNSHNEPNLANELNLEIKSCDSLDMLVSFIKWSGIRCLKESLEKFTETRKLRVITTSYMGASDYEAIEFLTKLPNTEVKISYDTKRTKHHAKAYMFKRETGFSTAYIGSSNLSKSAIEQGLEWNVKVSERDSKDIFDKFEATFESYWNDEEFITFDVSQEDALRKALQSEKYKGEKDAIYDFNITPNFFQKDILEKLKVEREIYNKYKNLVVAATGVGKTVISAFDYKRFAKENKEKTAKLLFVAHKQEILKQSLGTFRTVLRERNFGELYYGGKKPNTIEHLFVTIQTFNSQKLYEKTTPDFYDFIIVDEFHHSSADSYQELLKYYRPKVLLGLTATPERMDGKNVLEYFDDRIAAELRLGEAIDNKLLSPFHYFCISDNTVDYSSIDWKNKSYDTDMLDNLISGNTQRADLIIKSLYDYLRNIDSVIGLGFCNSVKHAEFMADYFNRRNIPSVALHANSTDTEREYAIASLKKGRINFIFTRDLFNEGIDIPEVNTVLFLRPTESLTIFIQQLGRGLRISEGKECVTVLDYVGQAHKHYNYYEKFAAISRKKGKELKDSIEENNVLLPKGCYLYLEPLAKKYIIENIGGYVNDKRGLIRKLQEMFDDAKRDITLKEFIDYYDVELLEIYKPKRKVNFKSINYSFYRLCVEAGIKSDFICKDELMLANSLGKVTFINSAKLLKFLILVMENLEYYKNYSFNEVEDKMLLMFHYTLWGSPLKELGMNNAIDGIIRLYDNKEIFDEVLEILKYKFENIDTVGKSDESIDNSPLEIHCNYTADQVLVALGKHTEEKKFNLQAGVLPVDEKNLDAFFITLNKVEKHYSPSTMYKDYAISSNLFHWQTQSKIHEKTPTFKKYINHKLNNHKILLFVREYDEENGFTCPYTYLGAADYVSHYGNSPVNIIWKLHEPLPPHLEVKAEKAL